MGGLFFWRALYMIHSGNVLIIPAWCDMVRRRVVVLMRVCVCFVFVVSREVDSRLIFVVGWEHSG